MRNSNNYYVGFDIGTNSVGWAVTDENYKIFKYQGKKMWGVLSFEEAKTAESRRVQRSARRRLQRRNTRIDLLQELMAEEIYKVDPGFYQRLEDSKFYLEDKTVKEKHNLFVGTEYNDADFHKEFPTIYHLRLALIKENKKHDIRLIYLALHHILKNRGHFLYEGEKFDMNSSIDESIKGILGNTDIVYQDGDFSEEKINKLKQILLDKKTTKTDKKKIISELVNKNKQLISIFGLAVGTKETLVNLYANEEYKELDTNVKSISFSEKIYDEIRNDFEEVLEEKINLLDNLKKLYDSILLTSIKEEGIGLSESKIKLYEKHKEDLKKLKKIIGEHSKDLYDEVFSNQDKNIYNYKNYVGDGESKCTRKEFYGYLKSILDNMEKTEEINNIIKEIELDTYMPLQRVRENGVIPYQVHQEELESILTNAAKYYPFLEESDGKHTIKEKIMKIMTFRIPYYVGPINLYHKGKENGFAWAEKREGKEYEKIYPWNFDEVIDLEASHDEFIKRMTNKCTYLKGKDVIAKNSLLYSEFMLLNEMNNIRLNGERIEVNLRDKIIENFFKKKKSGKITEKQIKEFLISEGDYDKNLTVTGIDGEIKQDIKSYRDFHLLLGEKFNYEMVEKIINWITLYGNEKKHIKKRIKEEYPNILSENEINKICNLSYKDWGRFSKEFLTEIVCDKNTNYTTGEVGNIITALRDSNKNLMQLMSNEYTYREQIDKINNEYYGEEELSYQMLDDMYMSPGVKRMIWQSVCIMEEIKKIMGRDAKRIFIETIRTNKTEKRRTDTRKKKLQELYSTCKEDAARWKEEIGNLSDGDLRSKKLYLYYLQMGKCMYSGENIDLNKLNTDNNYDIDHIYPRSKVKDDSFDNLVLVKKELNSEKADVFPINPTIQEKMKKHWDYLFSKGYISAKKYNRLVRREGFKDNELADFINRQLVETSQSTKAVAEIMNRAYKGSEVVYVKAENVSDFRREMGFIKVREINDYHHAADAYLNIVVGNVYHTKFTKSPINFIKNAEKGSYSLNRMFDFEVRRGEHVAWEGKNGEKARIVKKEMASNDVRVIRRAVENKGQLFDLTVYDKKTANKEGYLGLKNNDPRLADTSKYGGVTKIRIAYYVPYYYKIKDRKGVEKEKRRLIGIPIYLTTNLDCWENVEDYIFSQIPKNVTEQIIDFHTLKCKLKIGSLIKYNGFFYFVGGKSGESFYADNSISLVLGEEEKIYIKEIYKFINTKKINKNVTIEDFSRSINKEKNLVLYNNLLEKLNKPIYQKSTGNKYEELNRAETRERFQNLKMEDQINILTVILNMLTNKVSNLYDVKPLGISSSRRRLGFDFTKATEFKLINQSVTGLYESYVDLLE
ncbi:MAG: type II CRISPR RNA-guided endonuclease Cas9 [Clostridiales bacterium]|nr:type II CRISPR RNA-guided endonuclease Cas9 [Clostridiales bacterium]